MASTRLNIDTVAIIGAGPCGLAAAKYFLAEKKFSKIDVFEQRSHVGGVWNYTAETALDANFTIPRTKPSKIVDKPVLEDGREPIFVSPVYDALETNIPHQLMNYSDTQFPVGSSLFPPHVVVRQYLWDYADELKPNLKLQTQVLDVVPIVTDGAERWRVTTRNIVSQVETTEEYDAVVCANGHYCDPFIPAIDGLEAFNEQYPGIISHSKYYRRPNQYKDKRVIVVGNSASGLDISAQISTVSKGPVLVSEKIVPADANSSSETNIEELPEIAEFLVADRGVRFANGRVETEIDSIVFCTGYQYSYPFLTQLDPPLVTTGLRTENVYEHIIYHPRPSLSLLGLPQRIVPLPTSEAQVAYVARIYAGRLDCPSQDVMQKWEADTVAACGNGKLFHNLAFPKDAAYINRLHDRSMTADLNPALENGGKGKIPPYWGAEKQWVRERFPLIKIASRNLGAKRTEVKTLEALGFDFQQWKLEQEKEAAVGAVAERGKKTETDKAEPAGEKESRLAKAADAVTSAVAQLKTSIGIRVAEISQSA